MQATFPAAKAAVFAAASSTSAARPAPSARPATTITRRALVYAPLPSTAMITLLLLPVSSHLAPATAAAAGPAQRVPLARPNTTHRKTALHAPPGTRSSAPTQRATRRAPLLSTATAKQRTSLETALTAAPASAATSGVVPSVRRALSTSPPRPIVVRVPQAMSTTHSAHASAPNS